MRTQDKSPPDDLIDQFIFFLDPGESVLPLNHTAERLVSGLESGGDLYRALFNVENYEELRSLVASGKRACCIEVDGKEKPLCWELASFKHGIIAVAADASAVEQMWKEAQMGFLPFRNLVLNILPEHIAEELAEHRKVRPKVYRPCTILFTDVVNFSLLSKHLDPGSLIDQLNFYFSLYDKVMEEFAIEKIKTIGDSYMGVSGIPKKKPSHAVDCCLAALTVLNLMEEKISKNRKPERIFEGLDLDNWSIRIGIHTGPCISGVVGFKKYTFDIWGDSVNIASRMEQAGAPGRINVSEDTAKEVRDFFACDCRGTQKIKNIGEKGMYFLNRISPELSDDELGYFPNKRFNELYCDRFVGSAQAKDLTIFPISMRNYLRSRDGGPP